jgi:citrate lyase subunit beta/citryl-CoA lyase
MMVKAAGSAADHVFLDLEDAVAPIQKIEARRNVIQALNGLDWGSKVRCVRINDLATPYAYEDLVAVVEGAGANVDTIMIPKVLTAADISFVDRLVSMIERKAGLTKRIGLEALIEEVEGLQNVESIAQCTDRLECLIFGVGDFAASMGISMSATIGKSDSYPGDIWHYARFRLVMACRASGIDAVDGPYADIRNGEGYTLECRRAATLGFVGKWALHPSQITTALTEFTPDPDKVAHARRVADAYAKAAADGRGAIEVDGVMIDAAVVRILRATLLDRGGLYGM